MFQGIIGIDIINNYLPFTINACRTFEMEVLKHLTDSTHFSCIMLRSIGCLILNQFGIS
jgi:hypothetical protein